MGQYLHWKICKHYNTPHADKWYEHKTPPVVEGENTTILWDFPINTDRAIQANRPDIVIKDHKSKTCLLNDMTIPTDRNISVKEFDKLSKYKDLQIEIERMWHLKTTIVPVVVGALGMVKRESKIISIQSLENQTCNTKNSTYKYYPPSSQSTVNLKI